MKYLKTFEKIIEMIPMNIGYKFNEGTLGIMLNPDYEKYIKYLIKYFKDNDIKFRLFFERNFFFVIEPKSIENIPTDRTEYGRTKYFIPLDDDSELHLSWFYQDIFDDIDWSEIKIETEEDLEDIDMIINSKKYNL